MPTGSPVLTLATAFESSRLAAAGAAVSSVANEVSDCC